MVITYFFGEISPSDRHLQGWQAVVRKGKESGSTLVVVHSFENPFPSRIQFRLPDECGEKIKKIYSFREEAVTLNEGVLTVENMCDREGLGIYLTSAE